MALPFAVAGTVAAGAYLNAKLHLYQDLRLLFLQNLAERAYAKAVKEKRANCFYLFEESVRKHGDGGCLWSRTGCYSWSETYARVCQYANYFLSLGVQPGEIVALYLQNQPEFMFIWYGLLSIGCAPAMINYNLATDALVHCVRLSGSRILIVDNDPGCLERFEGSKDRIVSELGVKPVVLSQELRADIAMSNSSRPADSYRAQGQDKIPIALIYTSGTTGFSKAVPFDMMRTYIGGILWRYSLGQVSGEGGDRWYDCMPLYHGTGGISAICNTMSGISVAIGKRFSVRNFWKDVRDSQSTVFVYVGETARYLLAAPPSPDDKNHKLRLMYGNGMRPDVWERFQERFGVPEVGEFFNSTEGMFSSVVYSRSGFGRGAVGHHGWLMRRLMHNVNVTVMLDPETGDIWRDPKTGFAKRVPYDQGGELIVNIPDRAAFAGYWRSEKDTNKKFATDVFRKGDLYYRTGDALKRTDDGLWQFLDRLGDTFRWKGENVSTAEVAQVIGSYPGITEANVYGVLLPHHDGRAGCAAITTTYSSADNLDWRQLAEFTREKLPSYAMPLFIRVLKGEAGQLSSHNNKQDKVRLRDEGVDPDRRGIRIPEGKEDVLYWLPSKDSGYVPFNKEDWEGLSGRQVKL